MARLADAVGVSRQTVYNEAGSKPLLARAMILRELERFLGLVTVAFDDIRRTCSPRSGRRRAPSSRPRRTTRC